ncbi:hypothetical protein EVG20_g2085 [Dentipellis fragilis]|uniref:Protein YOP1 n=1 Tax=Dentipellis fragilis TaxID=205917 RepID=A0A4Y9ZAT9_9AGAM|nr:hypothetical protein EVG20_g2085 [Dentipellis fragilis]
MFMSLLSHLLSGWFAFLLPSYKTFKALKHRPVSEPELERWTTYWAIVGLFVAFEYSAEWLLSWFPFYWELKTTFLLYLSLPQLEGSSYIYKNYLEPYLNKNEVQIDAAIQSAQTETLAFVQTRLVWLWEIVWGLINKTPVATRSTTQTNGQASAAPNPVAIAQSLWVTFGSSFVSAQAKPQQQEAVASKPAASIRSVSSSVEPTQGYNVEQRTPQTSDETN